MMPVRQQGRGGSRAFTLIELLVVIAIIALLISILLPSLSRARDQAKAVKCAVNQRNVGQAIALYLSNNKGKFPASYTYPKDDRGNYDLLNQDDAHPFGYLHWSYFLYNKGEVNREAFECPSMLNSGMPRTNPGKEPEDWEEQQVDQNGQTVPNELADKQAERMGFTANAAIIPRNKFTNALSLGPRVNRLVNDTEIKRPGATILIGDFISSLAGVSEENGDGFLSKSHRPVQAFYHIGYGSDEYQVPPNQPGFYYGLPEDPTTFGVKPLKEVRAQVNLIGNPGSVEINAIGRHHPGGDKIYGGTANFLFVDGHVDRHTILESMKKKLWGDRYYSITGVNKLENMVGQ